MMVFNPPCFQQWVCFDLLSTALLPVLLHQGLTHHLEQWTRVNKQGEKSVTERKVVAWAPQFLRLLSALASLTHQNYVHGSKNTQKWEKHVFLPHFFWRTDPLIIHNYSLRSTIFTLLSYCQYEHLHKGRPGPTKHSRRHFGPCYIT